MYLYCMLPLICLRKKNVISTYYVYFLLLNVRGEKIRNVKTLTIFFVITQKLKVKRQKLPPILFCSVLKDP